MHAMGDVIDMRRFGGLRRALPITHWTFLVRRGRAGRLSAAVRLLEQGRYPGRAARRVGACALRQLFLCRSIWSRSCTALLTAFYTFRAYFMTFWGEERFPEEAGHHPHEAPPVMAWPLRVSGDLRRGGWNCGWADALVRELLAPYARLAGRSNRTAFTSR